MKAFRTIWILGGLFFAILLSLRLGNFFSPEKKIPQIEEVAQSFEDFMIPTDVKVIGIGEATHGNREFQIVKKELLQKLAEDGNGRAICFEMSAGEAARLNDAVHDSGVDLTEEIGKTDYPLYDTKEMVDLLSWMRAYDEKVPYEESLMIYGVDMQGAIRSVEYLRGACEKLPEYFTDDEVKKLLSMQGDEKEVYTNEKEFFETLYRRLAGCEKQEGKLLAIQAQVVLQSIDAPDYDKEPEEYSAHRDDSMADNLKSYSRIEAARGYSQIMITAHNGHVMKGASSTGGNDENLSMGGKIDRLFEGSYYCIGTEFYRTCVNIHTAGTYEEEYERANHEYCSEDPLAYQAKFFKDEMYCLDFDRITDKDSTVYKLLHKNIFTGLVGEGYNPLSDIYRSERCKMTLADRYDAMIFYYEATPIDPIHY